MSILVGNVVPPQASPESIFDTIFQNPSSARLSKVLLDTKKSSFLPCDGDVKSIGSTDVCTCVCAVYIAPGEEVVVHHHDGGTDRLKSLSHIFEQYEGQELDVHLIGGFSNRDKKGEASRVFSLLHKETQRNFKTLVQYWKSTNCKFNVARWTLGQTEGGEGFVSEFLVDTSGKITLYSQDTLANAVEIPCRSQREVKTFWDSPCSILMDEKVKPGEYLVPELSSFELERVRQRWPWGQTAMAEISDAKIQEKTRHPGLATGGLVNTVRRLGDLVNSGVTCFPATTIKVAENIPHILLQREAGRVLGRGQAR